MGEVILRCPDAPPIDPRTGFPADFADHDHSVIRTGIDLRLMDLTYAGQRRLSAIRNALLAGPRSTYPATRGWAERIHACCPDARGLYYGSFQLGPQFAVLLFGDRLSASSLVPVKARRVANAPRHDEIERLAHDRSIDYSDV